MHSLWIFFLEKRAFTYLLMASLSLGGMAALVAIPKESAPEVIIPIGIVTTPLLGASAEDTERLITDKIEDEVANLENIDKVTSISAEGISIVTAQFLSNANIDESITDLKEAVDKAKVKFPSEAKEPTVTKINFAEQPMLILSVSADLTPAELARLGEDLSDDLLNVRGVSSVSVSGTREREVAVVVKKAELDRYGLSVPEITGAIARANVSLPVGDITVASVDYPIRFDGDIEDPSVIGSITVGKKSGAPIYLRDVADVIDSLAPTRSYARASVSGEPAESAMNIFVFKKSGGDVTAIAGDVRTRLTELQESGELLYGANVIMSFDNGKEVTRSLNELVKVGLETVFLVILMLILTIGWRESLVAALSIPLSFVIAFIGLQISGNTINFVSLFSLILAIGILVDSGIVVTEAIHTRTKIYGNAYDAAVASIREYAWPLTAGTMATVVFFFPLFFISGIVGKFIFSIPFTLIFVLVASIVVALGMVPLIAIRLSKKHKNRLEELQDEYSEKAKLWYRGFLGHVFDSHRFQNWFITAMIAGLFVAVTLPVMGLVKVEFFPEDDLGFVYVEVEKPEGTTLGATDLAIREVEEVLYGYPEVESFVTTVGGASVWSGDGPASGSGSSNSKLANITVILPPKEDRIKTSSDVVDELRGLLAPIKSAEVRVSQPAGGPPVGAPVLIKFLGDDLDELTLVADRAERMLATIEGTRDVRTSARSDGTQFTLSVDRAKAARAGLTAADIAQTLRAAVSGITATTLRSGGKDIDVVVKLDLNPDFSDPEETRITSIDSIKQLPVRTSEGTILLGSVLRSEATPSRASISHDEKRRVISVTSQLEPNITAIEVSAEFEKRADELNIPETVTMDMGGENDEVNRSFAEMGFALLAGMILAFAILVLEFNSFRYSLYLIFIIPLSLIGVLFGLMISGQTLSFSSLLGVIALAGVIINHAIILLDSIIHRLREMGRESLREAIIEASTVRLRPIFLTTITTVVGMIPLARVSALWGPLAFTIMFGLTFAMLLTLILLPILFYRWPGKNTAD
jgi:multidrug efflux pump subunit AcrB